MDMYTTADIRRALIGRGFIIGALGMALAIILSQLESLVTAARGAQLLPHGYHAEFIISALSSDWVTPAIPVLCALPFTTTFVDDIRFEQRILGGRLGRADDRYLGSNGGGVYMCCGVIYTLIVRAIMARAVISR